MFWRKINLYKRSPQNITHTFLLLSCVRDTHAHLMWELREVRRTAASSMLQQDEDKAIKTSRRNSIFRCTNDCHGVGSIKKKKGHFFKKGHFLQFNTFGHALRVFMWYLSDPNTTTKSTELKWASWSGHWTVFQGIWEMSWWFFMCRYVLS